jgi:ferredoxin
MSRVGVFICHCGENIAGTVDVAAVAKAALDMPGVVHAVEYKYMCSDPGQTMLKDAIRDKKLDGVVVAACSPRMHEPTFRRTAEEGGINPYQCEMANLREHCSWVHEKGAPTTAKAVDLVRIQVEKVKRNHPLQPIRVPITKKALVLGGGIAGIQAALDIANTGSPVLLVEKSPSIGGHMSQLSETFPTLDCSQCILTPRMVEVARHPNITLYTYSELEKLEGFIGNFKATIRKKARKIDEKLCNGCGVCQQKCPVKKIPDEFNEGLSNRAAIYVPFPQAVPNKPVIDLANCTYYKTGKCKACEKLCPTKAIRFDQEEDRSARRGCRGPGHRLQDHAGEQFLGIRLWQIQRRHRRHEVRAPGLGVGPHRRRHQAPVRWQDAGEHRLHRLRRQPRSIEGRALLLEDLLHVHRQARDALPAQSARRESHHLLHGHPRRREELRRIRSPRGRGRWCEVRARPRVARVRGQRATGSEGRRHPARRRAGRDPRRHGCSRHCRASARRR